MWWLALLQIKSTDPEVRLQAVRQLGHSSGSRALTALVEATRDEVMEVRCAAIMELGKVQGDRAVIPLLKSLQDIRSEVRQAAVEALKDRPEEEVRAARRCVMRRAACCGKLAKPRVNRGNWQGPTC